MLSLYLFSRLERWRRTFMEVLILLHLSSSSSAHSTHEAETKCGIYLAPSTIPHSGLGLFAGSKHYMEDDRVTSGDLIIPVVDYEWNNHGGPYEDDFFLWNEYVWDCSSFPGMEEEAHDPGVVSGASPGVGAAANCYSSMMNINDNWSLLGRSVDGNSAGIGASTLYYGREFYATQDIPPGHEMFLDYGMGYFKHRTSNYGYLPDPNSFISTDLILRKYLRIKGKTDYRRRIATQSMSERATPPFVTTNDNTNNEKDRELWKEFYDIIKGMGIVWKKSKILNGLPEEAEQIPHIMAKGGASQQHYNRSRREISWLEEHGQCMDNIKDGDSDIPDAGRGAFANRFIPKGGLVAPAPLIHIRDYNAFRMFQPKFDEGNPAKLFPDRDGPYTFQLLLNYCFGHEKSTLLLCPYGLLTSFINHSHENPNTRIQWSERMRHPEWRNEPIDKWGNTSHAGLQIDFVALRDIEEDEEILIDYGSAWESAWQEHVKRFIPREDYIPAFELNEIPDKEYRTEDELDYEANGVFLMCHGWYVRQYTDQDKDSHCRVLKKLDNDRYLVQLLELKYSDKRGSGMTIEEGAMLWSVPSDALFFKDMPYSRDHFQSNAFRHSMMMPDDMFPDVWKNRA